MNTISYENLLKAIEIHEVVCNKLEHHPKNWRKGCWEGEHNPNCIDNWRNFFGDRIDNDASYWLRTFYIKTSSVFGFNDIIDLNDFSGTTHNIVQKFLREVRKQLQEMKKYLEQTRGV